MPQPATPAEPLLLSVAIGQCGPQPWERSGGGHRLVEWLRPALAESPVDLVVLSELATTPFFSVSTDRSWLTGGEALDGEQVAAVGRLAAELGAHVLLPFAERDPRSGVLYNSVALLGPDGEPVAGSLCSGPHAGEEVFTYRKVHLSENRNVSPGVHEKYFFKAGDGFVVFDTPFGRLAPLVCYDRSFPESWRTVRAAGARLVAVATATSRPERVALLQRELSVAAVHNGVFVLSACKAGEESAGPNGESVCYSGGSAVVSPFGEATAEASAARGAEVLRCHIDLGTFDDYDRTYHFFRDRRPDTYASG
ncbi:MAG: carbon-nitrogen hydrolase family protein [Acidimicrobiia bacterium]|nr:carbon-nitrogen hydrolase family protein [Acidimicrobiia bacterium]